MDSVELRSRPGSSGSCVGRGNPASAVPSRGLDPPHPAPRSRMGMPRAQDSGSGTAANGVAAPEPARERPLADGGVSVDDTRHHSRPPAPGAPPSDESTERTDERNLAPTLAPLLPSAALLRNRFVDLRVFLSHNANVTKKVDTDPHGNGKNFKSPVPAQVVSRHSSKTHEVSIAAVNVD